MARLTPPARASPSYRPRSSTKSHRGPISHPIPIPSALEDMFVLTPRQANFFVPVNKIDTSNCETVDLGDAQPSFAPAVGRPSSATHAFPSSFGGLTRLSDHWPGPSRLELTSPSSPELSPPPRSEFRHSVVSNCPSQHKKSTIRSAFNQLFGRKRSEAHDFTTSLGVWPHHAASMGMSPQYPDAGGERTHVSPATEYPQAFRSQTVGSEDSQTFQPSRSARNSLFINQSSASTTTSDSMSPNWNGPTALKPRPVRAQDWSNRYVEAIDGVDDIRPTREPHQSLSPHQYAGQADEKCRHASISSTIWFQPKFVGPEGMEGSVAQTTARPTSHETFDSSVWQFEFQDIPREPEMKVTDMTDLRTRMGAIENQLGRVEALLTQVYTSIPKCQPRLGDEHHLMPEPLSLTTQHEFCQSATCSSPDYSISTFEASTVVETTRASVYRDSMTLPAFCRDQASSFTMGHYTTLMALIESDRTTRMALESEVRELSQQIKLLNQEPPFHIERNRGPKDAFSYGSPQGGQGIDDFSATLYVREISA